MIWFDINVSWYQVLYELKGYDTQFNGLIVLDYKQAESRSASNDFLTFDYGVFIYTLKI